MRELSSPAQAAKSSHDFEVTVMSFGYKSGAPPQANVVFDVRFLKNPYWVDELRPLTGLDARVQNYVLEQPLAKDFLESLTELLNKVLPRVAKLKLKEFTVALGCTGGQHRSATIAEALAEILAKNFPHYAIVTVHRELGERAERQPLINQSLPQGERS